MNILLLRALTFLIAVTLAATDVFYGAAFDNAQLQVDLINITKFWLINSGFVVSSTEPASNFWTSNPLDAENISNNRKSDTLIIASQLFVDQVSSISPTLSDSDKRSLLFNQSDNVPFTDRCKPIPECDFTNPFPNIDGTCYNLIEPKLGAQSTPYSRLMPAAYDDGIHTIRRSVTNRKLPSPRLIGNAFDFGDSRPNLFVNYCFMLFGMYITHDVSNRATIQNDNGGAGLRCCSRDYNNLLPQNFNHYGCMPTAVPPNDPVLKIKCMNYVRSQTTLRNDCKLGPAEMTSTVTHFLDQSNIYGSIDAKAASLRKFKFGQLLLDERFSIAARVPNCRGSNCYFTGDSRATFFPCVTFIHSIFIRMHNLIAKQLQALNKHWNDEKLYQESRRIVTAVYQHIVYDEWLSYLIGQTSAERRKLSCGKHTTTYCGSEYIGTVDPSATNEFSNGAFRLFHGNVPETVNMYNEKRERFNSALISDTLVGPGVLEKNFDALARGTIIDRANFGPYSNEMKNKIFKSGNIDNIGVDMLMVDINRGRDHGNKPFHVYLNEWKATNVKSWNDLSEVFSLKVIEQLELVYDSPLDIDLLVGCLLERKAGEALVGPVCGEIIEEQFFRFKYGNRFFYSYSNGPYPFTPEQLNEINQQTWASVICMNSGINEMPAHAFETEHGSNKWRKCNTFARMNLNPWRTNF